MAKPSRCFDERVLIAALGIKVLQIREATRCCWQAQREAALDHYFELRQELLALRGC